MASSVGLCLLTLTNNNNKRKTATTNKQRNKQSHRGLFSFVITTVSFSVNFHRDEHCEGKQQLEHEFYEWTIVQPVLRKANGYTYQIIEDSSFLYALEEAPSRGRTFGHFHLSLHPHLHYFNNNKKGLWRRLCCFMTDSLV